MMMKVSFAKQVIKVFMMLFWLHLMSCSSDSKTDEVVSMPKTKLVELKNKKLDSLVVGFIEQSDTRNCAYELLISSAGRSSIFYLTAVNNYDAVTNRKLLVGYLIVNSRVVFISMKGNGIFNQPDDSLLRKQIGPFVPESFFNEPLSFFDPPIWRIELFADSLTVDKNAFSQDVPIKNIIITDSLPKTE